MPLPWRGATRHGNDGQRAPLKGPEASQAALCQAIAGQVIRVGRHVLQKEPDGPFNLVKLAPGCFEVQRIGHGIMAVHGDALPHHHCGPAGFGEQLVILAEYLPVSAEQFDLLGQTPEKSTKSRIAPCSRHLAAAFSSALAMNSFPRWGSSRGRRPRGRSRIPPRLQSGGSGRAGRRWCGWPSRPVDIIGQRIKPRPRHGQRPVKSHDLALQTDPLLQARKIPSTHRPARLRQDRHHLDTRNNRDFGDVIGRLAGIAAGCAI